MMGRITYGGWMVTVFILAGLLTGGCSYSSGGCIYQSANWDKLHGELGKVKIIITGDQYNVAADRPAKVCAVLKEQLQTWPGTTVIDDRQPTNWSSDIGEVQAIAAGKATGAQTVCVIDLARADGLFAIGIPELWTFQTRCLYTLRLLDVASGEELRRYVSFRQVGGPWEVCDPSNWQGNLREMLKRDLPRPSNSRNQHPIASTSPAGLPRARLSPLTAAD